jgi:hypothetical protein
MKKILFMLLCVALFACSKEEVTTQTVDITRSGDSYSIKISGYTNYDVTFNVYSKSGSAVFEKTYTTNGSGEFVWDGKTTNGNKLADGAYSFTLKGENLSKNGVIYLTTP